MKNLFLLWMFVGVLILSQTEINAQWVQTGPSGGRVNDLAVSGGKIYAASYGGVLISTNGIDWTHSDWGLMDGYINAVAVTSSRIFAGSQDNGVYVSDLNGLIWQQTSLNDKRINCMTAIGNNIFAGTSSTGVHLTTDNGTTWTQVNSGLTSLQVECFAVSGTNIFAGTGDGVFLSTNNGTNWTFANTGLPGTTILSLAVNGTNLYVGVRSHGIYYSPNNGQGWLQYGTSPTIYPYSIVFQGTDVYTTGGGGGIWRTTNNGTDWTRLNDGTNGMDAYAQVFDLNFIGENLVAAEWHVSESESMGLYTSANYGADWTQINWGQPKYCANGIAVANGNISVATCGGMYRSTDNGTEWVGRTIHNDYDWADFTAISFRSSTNGFAGDVNGFVYSSTNGGEDWWNTGQPYGDPVQIEAGAKITSFAFISTYLFAATTPFLAGVEGSVYFSSDNGATWERRSSGLPTSADTNTVVSSLAVIGNNLFAGTGHGVYLSTNNGTNWTKVNNGLTGLWVYSLAVKGTELFAGTLIQGVFRTNNNGTNWTHSLTDLNVTAVTVVDTNVFAGTWAQGVYRLINSDSSWKAVGLSNVYVTSFAYNDGYLFAATSANTVWKAPIDVLTPVEEIKINLPAEFNLSQNFPNPFNPTTTIQYSVEKLQQVTLKVYDILGNEISTLVNSEQPAGVYTIKFNGTTLSSGIYFYKLQTENYSETRKMLLMK